MAGHRIRSSNPTPTAQTAAALRAGIPWTLSRTVPLGISVSLALFIFILQTGQSRSQAYAVASVGLITGLALPYLLATLFVSLARYSRKTKQRSAQTQPTVRRMLIGNHPYIAAGHGFGVSGAIQDSGGKPLTGHQLIQLQLFFLAAAATGRSRLLKHHHETDWQVDGSPLDAALLTLARKAGVDIYNLDADFPRTGRKQKSVRGLAISRRMVRSEPYTFVRGDVHTVLAACTKAWQDGKVQKLTEADRARIRKLQEVSRQSGGTVMALAYRQSDANDVNDLILLGAVLVEQPKLTAVHKNALVRDARHVAGRIRQFNIWYAYVLLALAGVSALTLPLTHFAPVLTYPQVIVLGVLLGITGTLSITHKPPHGFHTVRSSRRDQLTLASLAVVCAGLGYVMYFVIHGTSGAYITPGSLIHRQATTIPFIFILLLGSYQLLRYNRLSIKILAALVTLIGILLYVPFLSVLVGTGPIALIDWLLIAALLGLYVVIRLSISHSQRHSRKVLFARHDPETISRHLGAH